MQGEGDGIATVWLLAAIAVAGIVLAVLLATLLPGGPPPPPPPY